MKPHPTSPERAPQSMGLSVATFLVWAGAQIAPRSMRPVFLAYRDMLSGFPAELSKGRKYGIVTAIWSVDGEGRGAACLMQDAALAAAGKRRAAIEAIVASAEGDA